MALGKEATASMLSVESQQQQMTYQRLFAMVDAEKTYHLHVIAILKKLNAEVIHPFDAQANGELSLSVDDYVVVRQVAPTGWLEGECKGQAGWFPSAYVERQEKSPASKIARYQKQTPHRNVIRLLNELLPSIYMFFFLYYIAILVHRMTATIDKWFDCFS